MKLFDFWVNTINLHQKMQQQLPLIVMFGA
jgi:hypothetical protein